MALNRELLGDYQLAFRYHQKSLELWKSMNEVGFSVLTLKHLSYLSQQLKINQGQDYQQQLQQYLQHEDFKGINQDILFKDFEKKIVCAREVISQSKIYQKITFSLQKIEEQLTHSISQNKQLQNNLLGSKIQSIGEQNILGETVWRQAVRLRLLPYQFKVKNLITNRNKDLPLYFFIKQSSQGIDQMKQTIQLMNQDKHPIIEKQLVSIPYIKDSVNNLKASVNKLRKFILYMNFLEPFSILRANMIQAGRMSIFQRQKATQQRLINSAYKTAMTGDYLLKCNKNNDGRHHKFFKMFADGTLRWASQEKNINNSSKIQFYNCKDIDGVIYGKITPVMRKNFNKKLEPFLCVSLILKTRSLDIFFEKEQINQWMVAISAEVKKNNPKAYVLNPGKFLWRKLKFQLMFYIEENTKNVGKKMTFCKALLLFKKLGLVFK